MNFLVGKTREKGEKILGWKILKDANRMRPNLFHEGQSERANFEIIVDEDGDRERSAPEERHKKCQHSLDEI